MDRKDFIRKGLVGAGGLVAIPAALGTRSDHPEAASCPAMPRETKGPFPNKTPAELVRANITGDRTGVPLLIEFTVVDGSRNCQPIPGAVADLWHCDREGHYSEYAGRMNGGDFTGAHFLRGRQTTDSEGRVSFVSIFPGYYPGRAPHLHLEVFGPSGASLLVTQIAFPEAVCDQVYALESYQGGAYLPNERDGIFRDSLSQNLADALTGNPKDGYTLQKRITVAPAT